MTLAGGSNATRRGVSLLEVLVATAIFLFSVVALGRLIVLSGDLSNEVQQQAQAAHLAQAKLAEVVAGVVALQSQSDVPFDEDPDWQWSMDSQAGSAPNLYTVTVKVTRDLRGQPFEVSLTQILYDPSKIGSSAQAEKTDVDTSGTMP